MPRIHLIEFLSNYPKTQCSRTLGDIQDRYKTINLVPTIEDYIMEFYELIKPYLLPLLRLLSRNNNICVRPFNQVFSDPYTLTTLDEITYPFNLCLAEIVIQPGMIHISGDTSSFYFMNFSKGYVDYIITDYIYQYVMTFQNFIHQDISYSRKYYHPNIESIKEPIKLFYLVAFILQPNVDLDFLIKYTSLEYMPQDKYFDLILTFMCYLYMEVLYGLPFPLSDLQSLYENIKKFPDLSFYPQLESSLEDAYFRLDYEQLKEIERKLNFLEEEPIEV